VYFGGLCDCAKFGGNRCRNFDSMLILILGLKVLLMSEYRVYCLALELPAIIEVKLKHRLATKKLSVYV